MLNEVKHLALEREVSGALAGMFRSMPGSFASLRMTTLLRHERES
jgi:hypothetical protein